MKNSFLLACLCFCFTQLFAQPYEVNSGEVLTVNVLTVVEMPDGIIVHDGGQIILQPQGYLTIGEGAEILVKDGGKIYSNGGIISGMSAEDGWYGLVVEAGEPNNELALELYNSFIQDANFFGIEMRCNNEEGARRILLDNVTFNNNNYSHLFIDCNPNGGIDIPNGSIIKDCTFINYAGWQIKTSFTNDLTFDGCLFTADQIGGGINLHMDQCRNTTIKNCTFEYGGRAIGLHYEVVDALVTNNTFYQRKTSVAAKGIELGYEGVSNPIEDVIISKNSFYPHEDGTGVAISAGWPSTALSKVYISLNDIYGDGDGFDVGVHITNASGGTNYINGNAIYGTQYGILAEGDNSNLKILCNGFDRNFNHIQNVGIIAPQLDTGVDPNNKFYDTGNYDILNAGPSQMYYYVYPFSPPNETPNSTSGVQLSSTFSKQKCKRDVGEEKIAGDDHHYETAISKVNEQTATREQIESEIAASGISIRPNPASEYLMIQNKDKQFIEQVAIYSASGQLMHFDQNMQQKQTSTINLSQFANGSYYCQVIYKNGQVDTKDFMVIK